MRGEFDRQKPPRNIKEFLSKDDEEDNNGDPRGRKNNKKKQTIYIHRRGK